MTSFNSLVHFPVKVNFKTAFPKRESMFQVSDYAQSLKLKKKKKFGCLICVVETFVAFSQQLTGIRIRSFASQDCSISDPTAFVRSCMVASSSRVVILRSCLLKRLSNMMFGLYYIPSTGSCLLSRLTLVLKSLEDIP